MYSIDDLLSVENGEGKFDLTDQKLWLEEAGLAKLVPKGATPSGRRRDTKLWDAIKAGGFAILDSHLLRVSGTIFITMNSLGMKVDGQTNESELAVLERYHHLKITSH